MKYLYASHCFQCGSNNKFEDSKEARTFAKVHMLVSGHTRVIIRDIVQFP